MSTLSKPKSKERDARSRSKVAVHRERYPAVEDKSPAWDRRYRESHREEANERSSRHYYTNPERKKKYQADRNRDAKIKAVRILGGRCQECGYDKHPCALQFHHRDPATKVFDITSKQLNVPKKIPWEMVLEEIQKCDLLCANCHFEEESVWELDGFWPIESE